MERKRHIEAHVTAERKAPKQKTQRLVMFYLLRFLVNCDLPTSYDLLLLKCRTEIGQGSGGSGYGDGDGGVPFSRCPDNSGDVVPQRHELQEADLLPKMDGIIVYYANQYKRPTASVTLGNQASDIAMTMWTEDWLEDHTEPHNVTFISGDGGFSKTLDLLTEAGHLVILVTNEREKDLRAYLQWTMRECLSLPPDRVSKNPSEAKQATTDFVPKSIVQLPDGSVQISIALENHTQKTVIRSIDDDCVSVVGVDDMGTNKEIMEDLGRVIKLIHNRFCLIGKKSKLMQFKKVGDRNKWTLVVEDMTDRQAVLKLVQART
ncbi:unnamed protein product [Brassica rapa]|uniref:NYN domain-containing protein n=1 Tax=Brassica campestris TaxID=3711 RepID=A0A8D9D9Z4_BRACM|nr:unnamed protein product [Brassica rapa]